MPRSISSIKGMISGTSISIRKAMKVRRALCPWNIAGTSSENIPKFRVLHNLFSILFAKIIAVEPLYEDMFMC